MQRTPSTHGLGWADRIAYRPVSNGLMIGIVLTYLIWLVLDFRDALSGIFGAMAWVSAVFAVIRLTACLTPKPPDTGLAEYGPDLPNYTVLVPLFHEAQMVPHLINGLSQLRYPTAKLEILLITEAVDPFTTQAVAAAVKPPFRHVIVPKGSPQTKPRALNYAMESAFGECVTIYDAEDRPHPNQLLAAIAAFRARPDWAAVQAPLDYFNADDNWLTRQFTLEYAALFHVWVPFLTRLGLPFPLGGTSNHMRRAPLDRIGGWDAHNVTEDADLSFRLAADGHKIGFIRPATDEEAVSHFHDWRYQRARWMKGYIQTWDVHMAAPFAPGGWPGFKRFLTLQLTLGLTLLSVLFYTPVALGLPIIWMVMMWLGLPLDISLTYGLTFVFSISVGCLIGWVGAVRAKQQSVLTSALSMPIYWLLLFTPTIRAFSEMRGKRFLWHKTRHGVSATKIPESLTSAQELPPIHEPARRPVN